MSSPRTLFDRILNPGEDDRYTAAQRREAAIESVVGHLTLLLNTRQGNCETLPDYGMPEMEGKNEAAVSLRREMETEIRNTILRYEPRLARVRVKMDLADEDSLVPRFIVTGELNETEGGGAKVSFVTILDQSGQIRVE